MLKQRIITAIVLVSLLLAGLFLLPQDVFQLIILAVFSLAGWEWANMAGLQSQPLRWLYAGIIGVAGALAAQYVGLDDGMLDMTRLRDVLGVGCSWWAFAFLWVRAYPGSAIVWGHSAVRSLLGLFVLVPSMIALAYMISLDNGHWVFLFVVGIVVCADVGAYFAGRKFGKKKLAPAVSPGKSWAGFWGGLACAVVFAAIVGVVSPVVALDLPALMLVAAITSLASVLGDLVESMVKRHRGIKDSSQLLPGHGGIMDRVDSMTAAAPVFALLIVLLQAA